MRRLHRFGWSTHSICAFSRSLWFSSKCFVINWPHLPLFIIRGSSPDQGIILHRTPLKTTSAKIKQTRCDGCLAFSLFTVASHSTYRHEWYWSSHLRVRKRADISKCLQTQLPRVTTPSQRKSQLLRFYYGLGLLPSCSCWNNFVLARLTAERRRHYYKAKQASSPTIRRAANKPVNSWVRLFNALHLEVNGLCASSRNVSINPSLDRSCVACSATGDRCGSKQEVISF